MHGILVDRYVSAIIDVAVESECLDVVRQEMSVLGKQITESDTLGHLLERTDDVPGAGQKIARVLTEQMEPSSLIANLLHRLARKKQMGLLPDILVRFDQKILERDGITRVTVTAIRALDPDETGRIKTHLNRLFPGPIDIQWAQNPSILGGLIIQSGDQVIDGSLKKQMQMLRRHMTHFVKEPVL